MPGKRTDRLPKPRRKIKNKQPKRKAHKNAKKTLQKILKKSNYYPNIKHIMKSKLPLILINLSLISSPLGANAAKIYTCTINGETVYTTKPSKSCHSTDLPPIGNYSSERYIPPQTPEPAPSPSNGGQAVKYKAPVKTVSKPAKSNTPPQQAPVNNSRRSILEAELSNERKALTEAQKMLSQARLAKGGNINHQKINALQSNVLDRQQNIQALQRELGRM